MSFRFQLLLLAVLAAGVLLAWLRGRRSDDGSPAAARERLAQLAWALALALLAVSVMGTLSLPFERNGITSLLVLIAVAVAVGLAVRPALARKVVPVALILLGLAGFVVARDYAGPPPTPAPAAGASAVPSGAPSPWLATRCPSREFTVRVNGTITSITSKPQPMTSRPQPVDCLLAEAAQLPSAVSATERSSVTGRDGIDSYGVTMVGNPGVEAHLILPQAWLFLLLGLWLAWRSAGPALARARHGSLRLIALGNRSQWRSLALLPVVVLAAEMAEWVQSGAAVAAALVLAAAAVVMGRWPGVAARIATAGLLVLAVAGLVVSLKWQWQDFPVDYGAVVIDGPRAAYLGMAQALALLVVGAWLVPQSFPEIRPLLGLPPADPELTRRVQQLTRSREVAVDTAATQLRRLERDLHDGAQARLVALGMSLRAAERMIPVSPDAAVALVAEARETAAKALTELRELVRGVHPPVLADRGLADAIRALALDSPLRVRTDIDLPGRLPAPVETACYFAVAEILTNAAKHSGSREAQISVAHADGLLRIVVTDFGLGGADPAAGSGLAGVERRLATFDGILAVSSPVGGPTIVVLEVPCALSSPKISSC